MKGENMRVLERAVKGRAKVRKSELRACWSWSVSQ
jgi:hypothetical protein